MYVRDERTHEQANARWGRSAVQRGRHHSLEFAQARDTEWLESELGNEVVRKRGLSLS